MTHRRAIVTFVCLAALALIAVGVTELPHDSSGGSATTPADGGPDERVAGGLTAAAGGSARPGGATARRRDRRLDARLAALKGYPVVINKWASWCVPCKEEFGAFQRVSAEYGRRVAFLGIDSEDPKRADARAFLKSFPVSYPSYYDPSGRSESAHRLVVYARDRVHRARRDSRSSIRGSIPSVAKSCAQRRRTVRS